ncbi:DUF4920 domain-containing protein [bacterium]|nr:DUF4920 domain-containing protein [bacterium]
MKTIGFALIAALFYMSCTQVDAGEDKTHSEEGVEAVEDFGGYGDTNFDRSNAIDTKTLLEKLASADEVEAVVKGEVTAACQVKGCWMKMAMGNEDLRVKFKDYGFFVPKNSAGQVAYMHGVASIDTTTVAEQVEWAKDANKSEEEIAAITSPKVNYTFVADGVVFE